MPGPQLGEGEAYPVPPEELREKIGDAGYDYLLMIHHRLFSIDPDGTGDLDERNVSGELTDTKSHPAIIDQSAYDHHGVNFHADLDQAGKISDAPTSSVSVSLPALTDPSTYNQAAMDLINEMRGDINTLVADLNNHIAIFNFTLAALKDSRLMASE